ncbi:MAG: Phage SPO1 DNA polymerase-related protein [uncultured bacterium]|nr:MAG: Phage SPO1 DNA polymerase-related protein [uncultured bacterium]KKQ45747.1 MAG: Phage SPO1 DNA polymerase-related protein [Candidatus Moranbacteria bacterium GW2011_GWC2_37_8]KKQ62316.1 MAG: Phage SPO1 DNA polymerase-related protein [Parcubacteria group bacterium GW2011_GWC1_38_22]KKQ80843.1 MAG: Phage SPO1 DNA polymerase-related protein [Candidatus Moranbacteria bacterium GW2011_GWD2_38_7]
MRMTKKEQLSKLNIKMSKCSKCLLHCGNSHIVIGDGNLDAEILFIGEAPGKNEDKLGIPFIGSSGRILDKMLESINLKREDVYITNILKCRPPENRDPLPEEVYDCQPWLEQQIKIINPKLIITLGRFSLNCFLPEVKISQVHGELFDIEINNIGTKKILPFYHPAAARQNRKTRVLFEEDFAKIPAILKQIKKEQ